MVESPFERTRLKRGLRSDTWIQHRLELITTLHPGHNSERYRHDCERRPVR